MAKAAAARSSATNWILVVAALAAILVFLLWLGFNAEPSVVTVVQEDTAVAGGAVTAQDLGADAARYHGQEIEVAGVTVARYSSPQVLWIDLPTGPFLVKLSDALAQTAPAEGTSVDVAGVVLPKTDSVLNAWQQAGAIPNAAERTALEAGTSFLEAVRITPAGGQ
ncbi:MAG TPA: hypothetical protein VMM83_03340 [Longimicrobiales bacterium]|nr:hypothetical protein [Longimicrobiales bacterium]